MEETFILLRFNCPDPTCDYTATGWSDLKLHVRAIHSKFMWSVAAVLVSFLTSRFTYNIATFASEPKKSSRMSTLYILLTNWPLTSLQCPLVCVGQRRRNKRNISTVRYIRFVSSVVSAFSEMMNYSAICARGMKNAFCANVVTSEISSECCHLHVPFASIDLRSQFCELRKAGK
jgi:hypothetical protein